MTLLAAMLLATSMVQPSLAHVGECGWVRGDYRMSNGSMIHRVWMVGTNHKLNLDVADESIPPPLKHIFAMKGYDAFQDHLLGDFYVCASAPRIPGHMQRVHLRQTRNLRIAK